MAKFEVLKEQWVWNSQFGKWTATIGKTFTLTAGEHYKMAQGDMWYEPSQAFDITDMIGMSMVAVGDMDILELPGNGGMFILGDGGSFNMVMHTSLPQSNPPGDYSFSIEAVDDPGAEKVIFPKKAISFGFNSSLGAYAHIDGTPDFVLEAGKDYIIEWGEKQVMRTAFAFTFADGSQCVGAGDPVAAGQQSNGDLFCLVNDTTNNLLYFLSLQEVSTVEVTVYAVADDLGGNDHPDETVILPAVAVAFAPGVNGLGEPIYTTTFLEFELVRWRKYRVSWEGEELVLMAYPGPNGVVCLGNLFITGSGENTGERFLIVYGDGYSNIATYEAGESREVAIWLTNEVGIVLQDYTVAERAYYDIDRLRVDTTDGGTKDFVASDLIPESMENVPIVLDFSEGNQTIVAPEGKVIKSAIIQQPLNLRPENIAEGVDIAGIIGTLAAGGGGKIAFGKQLGTGGVCTIVHNLGVLPDIVYVWMNVGAGGILNRALGFSTAFCNMTTPSASVRGNFYQIAGGVPNFVYAGIDANTAGPAVHNANENTFSIGSDTYPTSTHYYLAWFAIGGLT